MSNLEISWQVVILSVFSDVLLSTWLTAATSSYETETIHRPSSIVHHLRLQCFFSRRRIQRESICFVFPCFFPRMENFTKFMTCCEVPNFQCICYSFHSVHLRLLFSKRFILPTSVSRMIPVFVNHIILSSVRRNYNPIVSTIEVPKLYTSTVLQIPFPWPWISS